MLQSEKLEGQGMTVLLIEDDRRLAELVCTYLEHAGYQVVLTETGEEGIAAVQQVRPQVILLDLIRVSAILKRRRVKSEEGHSLQQGVSLLTLTHLD